MAPPVAVVVVASLATTAVVAYIAKEAWEPYIKPELTKAGDTVRAWVRRRERRAASVSVSTTQALDDTQPHPRSPSPLNAPTRPTPSRLESIVSTAFQLPQEADPGTFIRHRSTANNNGAAAPNAEAVEMSEMDKANPWIYHPPMSPAISSLPGTARNSIVSDTTEIDPFHDIHQYTPRPGQSSTAQPGHGLQLSFAGPSTFGTSELPPLSHPPSQSTPTSRSVRSENTAIGRTSSATLAPNSRTVTSSPASTFSWMDAASPSMGRRAYGSGTHPDDFVHMHEDDTRSENAFSIGSFDDFTTSGSGSSRHGQTPIDRSDAGSDDDEPMSPPHNSEQGSARSRSRSPSDWESVGSPSSSASQRRLV